jgi:hypothetical protein
MTGLVHIMTHTYEWKVIADTYPAKDVITNFIFSVISRKRLSTEVLGPTSDSVS